MRSLLPFDAETVIDSVRRTSRLITIEEQPVYGGWGSSVVAEVVEKACDYLDHPPVRLGTPQAPIAFSSVLEDLAIPSSDRVVEVVRAVTAG
jgi:pyruvate/2-oxoglutarate/acetoin dehydrogenase E1 component